MNTIEKIKANALKAFGKADDTGKTLLKTVIGEDLFSDNPLDYLDTFEDFCEADGIDPKEFFAKCDRNELTVDEIAYRQLKIIVKVCNKDVKADFTNPNQAKYAPWMKFSGSGLSYLGYDDSATYSFVGSRLCSLELDNMKRIANKFPEIYKAHLNG